MTHPVVHWDKMVWFAAFGPLISVIVNVGKTIKHPPNHHFYRWYKPFPNGWFVTLFYPHYTSIDPTDWMARVYFLDTWMGEIYTTLFHDGQVLNLDHVLYRSSNKRPACFRMEANKGVSRARFCCWIITISCFYIGVNVVNPIRNHQRDGFEPRWASYTLAKKTLQPELLPSGYD